MFEFTAGHIISSLKELLGEKYRIDSGGFSVLKEMVQNADDAHAATLRIAWLDLLLTQSATRHVSCTPGSLFR
jgi:hypothetical protein